MGKIYTKQEILKKIDYALLSPTATATDFGEFIQEAWTAEVGAVCVPPDWVGGCRLSLPKEMKICTVIGFPFGYDDLAVKVFAAKRAISRGANEIEMVIDIGQFLSAYTPAGSGLGWERNVFREIELVREACPKDVILKVIVEACYLSKQQKIDICKIVTDAGADYIRTSTGFGPGKAKLKDVKLFREHIGPNVKIKAAGGIATIKDTLRFLEAGADRIGSSKVVPLLLADERMEFSLD